MPENYEYKVFYYENDDGSGDWVCVFPKLPGCSGIGDTKEEAIQDGMLAKELWLQDYFESYGTYP